MELDDDAKRVTDTSGTLLMDYDRNDYMALFSVAMYRHTHSAPFQARAPWASAESIIEQLMDNPYWRGDR